MPLLSLGIPANAVMAVILGALLVQGIQPGPQLIANRPDLFFGVIASMLIGNLMLIVLNVPLISIFVQLLRVPGSIMAPLIIVFCVVGAYTLSNSAVEVSIMIAFGIIGYLMRKIDLDPAPLVLAFVLGNILETNFRQSLLVGRGTLSLYYTRPIAVCLLCVLRSSWSSCRSSSFLQTAAAGKRHDRGPCTIADPALVDRLDPRTSSFLRGWNA